jgi:hypothetical protein
MDRSVQGIKEYRCCLEDLFGLSGTLRGVDVVGRRGGVAVLRRRAEELSLTLRYSIIEPKKNKRSFPTRFIIGRSRRRGGKEEEW